MGVCEYEQLSKHQKDLVKDILSDKSTRRKRVLGNAGSGKTTIIAICATQLMNTGKAVFVCCYNKSLLSHINNLLSDYNGRSGSRLTVDNYHHFMWHHINDSDRNDFKDYEYSNSPIDTDGYRLPSYAKRQMFDYIFVDEMQDLRPNAVANLIDLLNNDGKICVFADKYQKLYDNNKYENEEENSSSNVPKFPKNVGFRGRWSRLDEVFRANNLIQEKALEFAKKELFSTYGVENVILSGNRADSQILYVTNFSIDSIADYISKMSKPDQENTVVLFHEKQDVDKLANAIGHKRINYISINNSKDSFDIRYRGVKISTVKSFKGMELPICIYVCGHGKVSCEDDYVGVTRATEKLIVCNSDTHNPLHNLYSAFSTSLF